MLTIIYGAKGSGKTKRIIERANKRADKSEGIVVYVTNVPEHSADVDNRARFLNIDKYAVGSAQEFFGFVKGMLAVNYDITDVFVDGLVRFVNLDIKDTQSVFKELEMIASENNVNMTFTLSVGELPEFLQKYSL